MTEENHGDLIVYLYGEPVAVRGVEMERAESAGSGQMYTDFWLHLQPEGAVDTIRENISAVKCEGGWSALVDALVARSMIPEWYAEGNPIPEEYDGE